MATRSSQVQKATTSGRNNHSRSGGLQRGTSRGTTGVTTRKATQEKVQWSKAVYIANGGYLTTLQKNCEICQAIIFALHDIRSVLNRPQNAAQAGTQNTRPNRSGGSLGRGTFLGHSLETLLSNICSHHPKLLAETLGAQYPATDIKDIEIYAPHLEDYVEIRGWVESSEKQVASGRIQVLKSPKLRESAVTGRLLGPNWIDRKLLGNWKERCYKLHGTGCSQPSTTLPSQHEIPAFLVDVWRQCLIRPTGSETYVALSYVWGGSKAFMTMRSNVAQLQAPSSLSAGKTSAPIAKTIRHAMGVVEMIDERYLWVDQLCVIQDDHKQKYVEINKMAAIYARASVTIIAAGGNDAETGLRGLSGFTEPRSTQQKVFTLPAGIRILESRWPKDSETPSLWNTRGWTYQEFLFSKRKIFFEGNRVRWECVKSAWYEGSTAGRDLKPITLGTRNVFSRSIPTFRDIQGVILTYNAKDLTYPEDALNAFAGIASALQHSVKLGFISGLPASWFDLALLWQPSRTLVRRQPKSPERTACLPSWSWAGWQGKLEMWMWDGASDFVKSSPHCRGAHGTIRVTPLTQFYWRKNPKEPGNLIRHDWFEYRARYLNRGDEIPCPAGWTRHRTGDSKDSGEMVLDVKASITLPDLLGTPKHFYKHESEPASEFWYPIPLPAARTGDSSSQKLARFISCKTRRAWLVGGELFRHGLTGLMSMISLRDNSGSWAGVLQLQDDPAVDVSMAGSGQNLLAQRFELVEVAQGYALNSFNVFTASVLDEWDLPERPKGGALYEFFYVMWIEWNNGIAYRRGLGRVEKNAWEKLDRDWVDLILG